MVDMRHCNYTRGTDAIDAWSDKLRSGEKPTFFPIGEDELRRIEIGPGLISLFGGAPGAGKTAFIMQAVLDALQITPSLRAVVCNIEMRPDVLLDRQLARLSGIDLDTVRYRNFTEAHSDRIDAALQQMGHSSTDYVCAFSVQFGLRSSNSGRVHRRQRWRLAFGVGLHPTYFTTWGTRRQTRQCRCLHELLFSIPDKLVRVLNRDLAAAGIAKIDDRGESIDVHALRHTFSTMLHRAGVSPSVAQAAMRHSDIRLTMKTYNHLGMMDVSGAVALLPGIAGNLFQSEAMSATGTDDNARSLASTLTSAGVKSSVTESFTVVKPSLNGVFAKDPKNEKTLVSQGKTRVFDSRSDRIRTYDPLVPNQMR